MPNKECDFGGLQSAEESVEKERKYRPNMDIAKKSAGDFRRLSARTLILQGIQNANNYTYHGVPVEDENELLVCLVKDIMLRAKGDDATQEDRKLASTLIERAMPAVRSQCDNYRIPGYKSKSTPEEKSQAILDAMMCGVLPADIAALMFQSLKAHLEIQGFNELACRVADLEARAFDDWLGDSE